MYVLPRALYSIMNEIIPNVLLRGQTGEFLTRWLERLIFSLSTGVVTTAVSLSFLSRRAFDALPFFFTPI